MIRSYRRAADAEDLEAMTQGKGSPVRNILTVSLPIGVLLWLGTYWSARSVWPALVVAGAFVLGSVWSNARFFRTVGARAKPGTDRSTVEVVEVEALYGRWKSIAVGGAVVDANSEVYSGLSPRRCSKIWRTHLTRARSNEAPSRSA